MNEGRKGTSVEIIATKTQVRELRGLGFKPELKRNNRGLSALQYSARIAADDGSYDVYRPYWDKTTRTRYVGPDATAPAPDPLRGAAERGGRAPGLVKAVEIGKSLRGVPILALKVTRNARTVRDGRRPAVLYSSNQHAREWITPEMTRRLAHSRDTTPDRTTAEDEDGTRPGRPAHHPDRRHDRAVVRVSANPDGYDFTFTPGNRLWRRTCATSTATGRSRAATASTSTATSRRTGTTTTRARRRIPRARPTAAPARRPSPRRGRWTACCGASASPSRSTTTRPPSCCCTRSASRSRPTRRTTRSTRRCRGPTRSRRSRARRPARRTRTTRTSRPSSTRPTARRPITRTASTTRWPGRRRWTSPTTARRGGGPERVRVPGLRGRPRGRVREEHPVRARRGGVGQGPRRTRSPTWATRCPTSRSSRSRSPTAIRSRSRRTSSAPWARCACTGASTAARPARPREYRGGERYGGPGDVYYHRVRGDVRGTRPGDRVRVWFQAGARALVVLHLHGAPREPGARC